VNVNPQLGRDMNSVNAAVLVCLESYKDLQSVTAVFRTMCSFPHFLGAADNLKALYGMRHAS
jgi:hypothetical protein